jgi:hypothetical protein
MKKVGVVAVLLLVLCATAPAQGNSDESARIRKLLREKIGKEMPGWTHRSIEPIEGSQGVIIQQWESGNIVVKIALTRYLTPAQAARSLQEFKSQLRVEEQARTKRGGKEFHLIKEDLSTLGDEGFVVDDRGSESVAFRRGEFIVNISTSGPSNNKDGFFGRKFAEHVVKILEQE